MTCVMAVQSCLNPEGSRGPVLQDMTPMDPIHQHSHVGAQKLVSGGGDGRQTPCHTHTHQMSLFNVLSKVRDTRRIR